MAIAHVFPGAHVHEHGNFGYPYRGSRRRIAPTILEAAHITGNPSLPSALAEMKYSARPGSGASFPFAINPNGTVVQGFDPFLYAPWTNGDLRSPDVSNPIIAGMARSAYNPNEFCLFTVEHVGHEPSTPISDAALRSSGRIAAWARETARREFNWSLPIDLVHIIGHRQINSVTRAGCPTRGDLVALKRTIIAAATPVPEPEEPDVTIEPATPYRRIWASFKAGTAYAMFRPGDDPDPANWTDRRVYRPAKNSSATIEGPFRITTSAFDGERWRVADGTNAGQYISDGPQPQHVRDLLAAPHPAPDCSEAVEKAEDDTRAAVNDEWREWLGTAPAPPS